MSPVLQSIFSPEISDATSNSLPDLDLEEMDIHGKLVVLNAINLHGLTLASRCAMILLSGPWATDDYGRFMSHPGSPPKLSALSRKQAASAVNALKELEWIRTWSCGASLCWEVAGAFAFKKGLAAAMRQRAELARQKRLERAERKKRRQARDAGFPYMEDDEGHQTKNGKLIEMIRTSRGGHVPMRPTMFYRSTVPMPKGKNKFAMIVPQPKNEKGCLLHMYPSFNVYAGLSPLGVVIRHQLLWEADDYGRVCIDIDKLYSELGPAITKRVSKNDIEVEIQRMSGSGHMLLFHRSSGTYAYVRDAAQHMKDRMFRNMKLPNLVDDRNFTYDSEPYKAFLAACREHAVTRDKVEVFAYSSGGDVYSIKEYVEQAAKRFLAEYDKVMNSERYANATPETIFEIDNATYERLSQAEMFWYAFKNKMPYDILEGYYDSYKNVFSEDNNTHFKILRYLMKMTPKEYLEKLRLEELG